MAVTGAAVIFTHDSTAPSENGEDGSVAFKSPAGTIKMTMSVTFWKTLGCPERFIADLKVK